MSRLACKCGCTLGTSESPSPYSLYVYSEEEIRCALNYNPSISLHDFMMDWDELTSSEKIYTKRPEAVEYWKCLECGRVYEVQAVAGGKKLRTYCPMETSKKLPDYTKWRKIVVISDVVADKVTEDNMECMLSEFLLSDAPVQGWISTDETEIIIVYPDRKALYCLE